MIISYVFKMQAEHNRRSVDQQAQLQQEQQNFRTLR